MSDFEDELQLEVAELKKERDIYKQQRDAMHRENIDLRIKALEIKTDDHETRLRAIEVISTRSNILYTLATGGGLISIIALIRTISITP